MPTVADLQALANSLQAVPSATIIQPGQTLIASITPDLSSLKVADTLTGALDLTFLTKGVRFGNPSLESDLSAATLNRDITNGMPIVGVIGAGSTTDVPGTIGQIQGSLPLGAVQSPVNATVSWAIADENGNDISNDNTQVATPSGLNGPSLTIMFAPPLIELKIGVDPTTATKTRSIQATVTLAVGGISSGPVPLPTISVQVLPLLLPTIFSLFRNKDFQAMDGSTEGVVLVVVPSSSPLKGFSDIQSALKNLQSVLSGLTTFADFVAFASRLNLLVSALNSISALDATTGRPHTAFQATDSIPDLSTIDYWHEGFLNLYDVNAADRMNALILIGVLGKTVECDNRGNFDSTGGQFTVAIVATAKGPGPTMFATCRDLGSATPPSDPSSALVVTVPPHGTKPILHNITQFGGELESIRFTA